MGTLLTKHDRSTERLRVVVVDSAEIPEAELGELEEAIADLLLATWQREGAEGESEVGGAHREPPAGC